MQIDLPANLAPFVEQEFSSGHYSSREEVLIRALEHLRNEREQALAGIQEGLNDVAAGRVQPLAEALTDIRLQIDDTQFQ